MDNFKRDFGKNLRRRIGLNDYTQIKFCEKAGISEPTLSGWIAGKKGPNIGRLTALAKVLNCEVYELFLSPVDNKSF